MSKDVSPEAVFRGIAACNLNEGLAKYVNHLLSQFLVFVLKDWTTNL